MEGPDTTFTICRSGQHVTAAATSDPPDLAVLDMQIGNMGGIAVCMDLRLDETGGRLPHIKVLMLLDRTADLFLARRAGAEGWLVKPLDSLRVHWAANTLLAGGTVHEGGPEPPATGIDGSRDAAGSGDVASRRRRRHGRCAPWRRGAHRLESAEHSGE